MKSGAKTAKATLMIFLLFRVLRGVVPSKYGANMVQAWREPGTRVLVVITVVTWYSHRQWIEDKDSRKISNYELLSRLHSHSVPPSSGNRAHFCARVFLFSDAISRERATQNLEARPRNRNDQRTRSKTQRLSERSRVP